MTTSISLEPIFVGPEGLWPEVVCHGLLLASIATRLRVEWHAGLIDAEAAMRELDSALAEICALRQEGSQMRIGAAALG
jgi:hypothetical protein